MRYHAILIAALLAVTGCDSAGPGSAASASGRDTIRIAFVTHGQSADAFWSVVSNGARDAARDLGVDVQYQAPTRFDMVEMSNLIRSTTASRPHGLVVSIPDPAALAGAIRAATDAGIPVISINSGADDYRALGALAHVGQTEYEAGFAGGERLAAAGVRRALCINHEVGNTAQDLRCRGLADALAESGASATVLGVSLADPADAQQRIAGALRADSSIDGMLALGPSGADPALAALRATGRAGRVAFGTFDLTPRVLEAVRDGEVLFAIDQQQYLQGYLPVILLVKYLETRALPGGGDIIRTGPGFVTRADAASVIDLTARGIR
ncbi:MAG TPA: sugar ABC transporter substrate-binding protein [Longimicrobiales bacterium]|nr:sugar ABC transporter substrate-binding protein [Longimicrobiales bacterium]